jgi:hypothetical protein
VGVAVGGLIVLGSTGISAGLDTRARLREQRRGEEPPDTPSEAAEQGGTFRRAPRPAWWELGFSFAVALGLPITIIGVASDQKVVLIVGLVLLGLFLLDLAVLWPLRGARRGKAVGE